MHTEHTISRPRLSEKGCPEAESSRHMNHFSCICTSQAKAPHPSTVPCYIHRRSMPATLSSTSCHGASRAQTTPTSTAADPCSRRRGMVCALGHSAHKYLTQSNRQCSSRLPTDHAFPFPKSCARPAAPTPAPSSPITEPYSPQGSSPSSSTIPISRVRRVHSNARP